MKIEVEDGECYVDLNPQDKSLTHVKLNYKEVKELIKLLTDAIPVMREQIIAEATNEMTKAKQRFDEQTSILSEG